MKNNSAAIIIPARLNSTRFPQKILAPIAGKPLIIRVLETAQSLGICDCWVACCCEEVKKIVEEHGGKAIVTDPSLPSGTDRVYAALQTLDYKPDFALNLQGDLPVFDAEILPPLFETLELHPEVDMTTPVKLIDSAEAENENTVKVVFNNMEVEQPGQALYFSRKAIPHGAERFYGHIGIYAYRREALERFINLPISYLEKTERLEQLRALQNGFNIWAIPTKGRAISVDSREDLERVIAELARR